MSNANTREQIPARAVDINLPQLAPVVHAPTDRRIAHNNALRTAVHMGNLLAARLEKVTGETVDFESEGLILAWQRAVEHLRSFR